MPFPMLENPSGEYCIFNGERIPLDSTIGASLSQPISDIIYYESIRLRDGILVFFENHMLRLLRSIAKKENFPLDTEKLYDQAMRLIQESEPKVSDGNIRIVITSKSSLVHFSDAIYPSAELFASGIITSTLFWERREPQVKVFRDDYKNAVFNKIHAPTSFGVPYEVLLVDHEGHYTEGSRSNFFVLFDGVVYSPPEEMILIGITRKYVLKAIEMSGLAYQEKIFTLDEMSVMQNEAEKSGKSFAVFVTSSPFDILPVRTIDDISFLSSSCSELHAITNAYQSIVAAYITSRKTDPA